MINHGWVWLDDFPFFYILLLSKIPNMNIFCFIIRINTCNSTSFFLKSHSFKDNSPDEKTVKNTVPSLRTSSVQIASGSAGRLGQWLGISIRFRLPACIASLTCLRDMSAKESFILRWPLWARNVCPLDTVSWKLMRQLHSPSVLSFP